MDELALLPRAIIASLLDANFYHICSPLAPIDEFKLHPPAPTAAPARKRRANNNDDDDDNDDFDDDDDDDVDEEDDVVVVEEENNLIGDNTASTLTRTCRLSAASKSLRLSCRAWLRFLDKHHAWSRLVRGLYSLSERIVFAVEREPRIAGDGLDRRFLVRRRALLMDAIVAQTHRTMIRVSTRARFVEVCSRFVDAGEWQQQQADALLERFVDQITHVVAEESSSICDCLAARLVTSVFDIGSDAQRRVRIQFRLATHTSIDDVRDTDVGVDIFASFDGGRAFDAVISLRSIHCLVVYGERFARLLHLCALDATDDQLFGDQLFIALVVAAGGRWCDIDSLLKMHDSAEQMSAIRVASRDAVNDIRNGPLYFRGVATLHATTSASLLNDVLPDVAKELDALLLYRCADRGDDHDRGVGAQYSSVVAASTLHAALDVLSGLRAHAYMPIVVGDTRLASPIRRYKVLRELTPSDELLYHHDFHATLWTYVHRWRVENDALVAYVPPHHIAVDWSVDELRAVSPNDSDTFDQHKILDVECAVRKPVDEYSFHLTPTQPPLTPSLSGFEKDDPELKRQLHFFERASCRPEVVHRLALALCQNCRVDIARECEAFQLLEDGSGSYRCLFQMVNHRGERLRLTVSRDRRADLRHSCELTFSQCGAEVVAIVAKLELRFLHSLQRVAMIVTARTSKRSCRRIVDAITGSKSNATIDELANAMLHLAVRMSMRHDSSYSRLRRIRPSIVERER